MARQIQAKCKLCRAYGEKLFLKGAKCNTEKCPVVKRPFGPGQHGKRRRKESNYGLQLGEKQKAKRIYGILERQFRKYFKLAERARGITGHVLLQMLERRLDNVIFRLCFAYSRSQARQLVRHNHVYVNNKKVNIPSYMVKVGDVLEMRGKENILKKISEIRKDLKERAIPKRLQRDKGTLLKGAVTNLPQKEDIDFSIQEQLIVELYSK
ncbi:MAG: 30S ribosomal protein S4 [Candidatus Omnitrophota bacterium]|nr:MAG: 30S ribosomal protein S4 [Candidatus Omnitrophota bacterium]